MVLASEQLSVAVGIATVVVPVAVYFLILGLLNSRRHPQLLTGRRDFSLLVLALSPMFVLPVLNLVGVSVQTVVLAATAVAVGLAVLSPRGNSWVIYNMPLPQAMETVADVLRSLGLNTRPTKGGLHLGPDGTFVEVGGFPLLRNVSVHLRSADRQLAHKLEAGLARKLASVPAQSNPAAVALLLIATAMLVLPMTLMAERVPEVVRILTGLLD